ncbi:hypothetical protein [Terrabacter terrigena]|uniref:Uncharacterized protein n=1 Tax=Terrabacter terrigena TaxID=574718 RepID=A0ABW3MWX5_9MICO
MSTLFHEPTLFDSPQAAAIDDHTRSVLALMDIDPIHASDRLTVIRAVVETALAREDRLADPNEWRPKLLDGDGVSTVHPNTIGATVASLRAAGVLVWDELPERWVITTGSTSGNNGKPARVYRLAQLPDEAR